MDKAGRPCNKELGCTVNELVLPRFVISRADRFLCTAVTRLTVRYRQEVLEPISVQTRLRHDCEYKNLQNYAKTVWLTLTKPTEAFNYPNKPQTFQMPPPSPTTNLPPQTEEDLPTTSPPTLNLCV